MANAGPVVVVGGGRVGRAFLQIVGPRGILVNRGECVPIITEGANSGEIPLLVATHCSHLDAVLKQTARDRWKDLVFMQNGMLQPWLRKNGLEKNTQVLLYMSSSPQDPQKPEGPMKIVSGGKETLVWGRLGPTIAGLMHLAGLPCSEVGQDVFLEGVVEKLLWSSIFWLLSASLEGLPVGILAKKHRQDILGLTGELLPLAKTYLFCPVGYNHMSDATEGEVEEMVCKLCDYSLAIAESVPSMSLAESEFSWRNGWFLEQKCTPKHVLWLEKAGFEYKVSQYNNDV